MSKPELVKKVSEARQEIKEGKGVKVDAKVIYAPKALKDLGYWKSSGSHKIQKRITELINAIAEDPFKGIGKPEPLKHEFAGC
jgi:YoeB-like toxin of type II toxin-antitoxin system